MQNTKIGEQELFRRSRDEYNNDTTSKEMIKMTNLYRWTRNTREDAAVV
jgi:hypothetical protein